MRDYKPTLMSLFDGIGTAGLAMSRFYGNDFNYIAFENDQKLIDFTNDKFKQNIIHKGSVNSFDFQFPCQKPPKVDVLICGSPCQGLSKAGKRKGLEDERSALFYKAAEIKNRVEPVYFLFENVICNKGDCDIISDLLGVQPVTISSLRFTPQSRLRYYWTNIDLDTVALQYLPERHDLYHVSRQAFGQQRYSNTIPTLTSNIATCAWHKQTKNGDWVQMEWGDFEIAQGLPVGYTDTIPNTKRRKALANAFTLPVIEWILSHVF